jgi:hypothetical protein
MTDQDTPNKQPLPASLRLLKLTPEQIKQIDEVLIEVGEYGEVHIIVQRGELRYINKVESHKFRNREDEN